MDKSDELQKILFAIDSEPITNSLLEKANALSSDLYWKQRDAESCFILLKKITTKSHHYLQNLNDIEILKLHKMLLYNLASYGWVGWGEADLNLSNDFQSCAIKAAKEHFEIAQSLKLSPIKQSRAHWILGALLIQDTNYSKARKHFLEAERLALNAKEITESINSKAFALLSDVLLKVKNAELEFEQFIFKMKENVTTKDFANQSETALKIFMER